MADAPDILKRIVAEKWQEIARRKDAVPTAELRSLAEQQASPRGFVRSIADTISTGHTAVIAEINKASPSKGVIRKNFVPDSIARDYAEAGATCLSVLTDEKFFQGSDDYLKLARDACTLPVLRKDFTVDPYQVFEARAIGADCILLIVSILDAESLSALSSLAREQGLDVLIEVHDQEELELALAQGPGLIGINNRNLHTFSVSLDTTIHLLENIPDDVMVISESGISTRQDVERLVAAGVSGFLVGESFMRAASPGEQLKKLFSSQPG